MIFGKIVNGKWEPDPCPICKGIFKVPTDEYRYFECQSCGTVLETALKISQLNSIRETLEGISAMVLDVQERSYERFQ